MSRAPVPIGSLKPGDYFESVTGGTMGTVTQHRDGQVRVHYLASHDTGRWLLFHEPVHSALPPQSPVRRTTKATFTKRTKS